MTQLLPALLHTTHLSPKTYGVSSFSSVLMDHTYDVSHDLIAELHLAKGSGAMGDTAEHNRLLAAVAAHPAAQKVHESLGGSCCNVIRVLAETLQEPVSFATNVGPDQAGELVRTSLASLPQLNEHITTSQGATGSTLVLVSPDGERTMHADLGVSHHLNKHAFCADDFLASHIFHFCGYQWTVPAQQSVLRDALHLATPAKVLISFDVADPLVAKLHQSEFIKLIDNCQIIFCNESEACALLGEDFTTTINQRWPDKLFAIKRGPHDAWMMYQHRTLKVPAYQDVRVIDTTGAGDSFAAGLLKGLLHNLSLEQATRLAHRVAADVTTDYGVSISAQATRAAHHILSQTTVAE